MARTRTAGELLPKGSVTSDTRRTLSAMRPPLREIFYALAVGAVGAFFLIQSIYVETTQDNLVGPQLVPFMVSWLIIGVSTLQLLTLFLGSSDAAEAESEAAPNMSGVARIVAVVGLGFAYIFLFSLTGYLVSTALVLGALLSVFGNRGALRLILLSLGGALVYYVLFIHFMGILDSIGWHLDLSSLGLR